MSSGILDYSDDQKRSGFVEATYSLKMLTMKTIYWEICSYYWCNDNSR